MDGRIGGNNSKLSQEQIEDLAERLKRYTSSMVLGDLCSTPEGKYWTVKDFLQAIEVWYGVTYVSRGSYYNLLERVGINLDELRSLSNNHLPEM